MDMPEFVNASAFVHRSNSLYRPHPGEVLKRRVLDKTKQPYKEVAKILGISELNLSLLIQGKMNITDQLAQQLASMTKISADTWLYYQYEYDLYKGN